MAKEYIEQRDCNYYVSGTRISLDSIVHAFRRGEAPETICQNFELLRLEEVYGASPKREVGRRKTQCRSAAGQSTRKTHARTGRVAHNSPIVKVRFLADADLTRAIVSGVLRREPSIDFLTAQAAGL